MQNTKIVQTLSSLARNKKKYLYHNSFVYEYTFLAFGWNKYKIVQS